MKRVRRGRARAVVGARCTALFVATALSTSARAALAQAEGPDWAFGEPAGEVAVGVVSTLSLGALLLPQSRWPWGPSSPRPHNPAGSRASDVAGATGGSLISIGAGFALESIYYLQRDVEAPYARAARTTIVEAEAVTLATGITMAIKRLSGRCRPRAMVDGRCMDADSAHTAFPSGHTSAVGAIAGSRLWMMAQSDAPGQRIASFVVAETFTVAAALLRVVAGAHSWEDVLAGAFVGHATGSVVAATHPMESIPPVDAKGGITIEDASAASVRPAPVLSWGSRW